MLREALELAFRDAEEAGSAREAALLRLVLTAVRERDATAREAGQAAVADDDIVAMLAEMVRQRDAEIGRCETCAHLDVAEREAEEIEVLRRFLPVRMDPGAVRDAVEATLADLGATRLKDAGPVIASLKQRFAGRLDVALAKQIVCERLH